MKNLSLKQIAVLFIMSAACGKFGEPKKAASVTGDSISSETVIESYGTPQVAQRTLTSTSNVVSSLDFLDDVSSANYVVANGKLKLSLYDSGSAKISIPSTFLSRARFKSSSKFIFVNLANTNLSTSLVIDVASKKVYLSKDSDISLLDLSKISESNMKIGGVTRSVVKARAQEEESGDYVYVGFLMEGDRLSAYLVK